MSTTRTNEGLGILSGRHSSFITSHVNVSAHARAHQSTNAVFWGGIRIVMIENDLWPLRSSE